MITFPLAFLFAKCEKASAESSNAYLCETSGLIFPSACSLNNSSKFFLFSSGNKPTHAPQKTPTIWHPFKSVIFSGIFGISPAAKPITRYLPSQAVALRQGSA